MKTAIIIAAASLACTYTLSAVGQQPPVESIQLDEFIGPFKPTPESRAIARKEAYAAYAWFERECRRSDRGAALDRCLKEARGQRDSELAYADGKAKRP